MLYLPFLKEKKKASGIHKPLSPIAVPGHTREQILKKVLTMQMIRRL